jgi:multiple sugar transport system permease protein
MKRWKKFTMASIRNTVIQSSIWKNKKIRTTLIALVLLGPALIISLVFTYYPALYVIRLSFLDWDLISPDQVYVGLDNFQRLFTSSSEFWTSLYRTLEYGLIYISLSMCLGLCFALALNRIKFLQGFFQSLYFIPSVTSIAVVSIVWSLIYNPQIGPLNRILLHMGLERGSLPQWLNDPDLAIPCLAIMGVWQSMGFIILLFIAGLKNIPSIYYDAAKVDGAKNWQQFRHITMPLLSPVLFFVAFMQLINSFRVFGAVAIMTKGRPLGTTNVLLYFIYENAFKFFDAGLASAASLIVFVIILGFVLLQNKLGERSVFYQ